MSRIATFMLAAAVLFAADTSWTRVKELKSRAGIDRLDARPAATPRKINVQKTEKVTDPDPVPNPRSGPAASGESTSSNVSFGGSKSDFETIYRRTTASAK